MTKVKICGLTRLQDIEAVNQARPDYAGFIMSQGFRRTVTPVWQRKLKDRLHPSICPVGVFVNEDPERIHKYHQNYAIEIAQLHGKETEDQIRRLKDWGLTVIKAVTVRSEEDLAAWVDSEADYLLLDNGTGTGQRFDWNLIRQLERPYFLAGGIDKSNLKEALKLAPYALDISSGVETGGFKDPEKIDQILREIRKA